jgi:DNA-binding NarL/FixJ family response regulator
MKKIAIVEDSEDIQLIYKRIFRKVNGLEIAFQAFTAEEALEQLQKTHVDLIIIDISLPGMDGIALTKGLRSKYPDLKIIVATGHDREAYESLSMEAGVDDFIVKGDGIETIEKTKKLLSI